MRLLLRVSPRLLAIVLATGLGLLDAPWGLASLALVWFIGVAVVRLVAGPLELAVRVAAGIVAGVAGLLGVMLTLHLLGIGLTTVSVALGTGLLALALFGAEQWRGVDRGVWRADLGVALADRIPGRRVANDPTVEITSVRRVVLAIAGSVLALGSAAAVAVSLQVERVEPHAMISLLDFGAGDVGYVVGPRDQVTVRLALDSFEFDLAADDPAVTVTLAGREVAAETRWTPVADGRDQVGARTSRLGAVRFDAPRDVGVHEVAVVVESAGERPGRAIELGLVTRVVVE